MTTTTWVLIVLALAVVIALVFLPQGRQPEDDDTTDRGPDNDRGMW